MSTLKRYWQDPYRKSFTARVVQRLNGERPGVILNRTLFYPQGGGQPADTGVLAGVPVLDVSIDAHDNIIHWLAAPLPETADEIEGVLDWARRYDHMQQHSGQHLLSAAFQDVLYRPTIGFHLSESSVTIDLPGPPPDDEALARVLAFVQDAILQALPITARLLPRNEALQLPLRKAPSVAGPIRVVEIHGLDWSACGGTHLRNTAEIGHLVVTRLERRGDQTRVYFLAGARAYADHVQRLRVTRDLGALLTTSLDELPATVARLQEQVLQSQRALRQAQEQLTQAEARRLIAEAPKTAGVDVVYHILQTDDPKAITHLAKTLVATPNVVALLGWVDGGKARWVAGRSANVPLDMKEALAGLQERFAVRGGGTSEMIQGVTTDATMLNRVLHLLQAFAFDLADVDA